MSDRLPGPEFWALLHPHTGDVSQVQRTERGFTSDLTAVVECRRGPFFVKAVRNRPGGRRDSIIRERLINPYVQPISPPLRWHAEDPAWVALGFELVDGRFSDFTPESDDLPEIVELINRIGRWQSPDIARDWTETRWDRYAESRGDAALFRGEALLYTDINPDNLLIGERERWAVDWAWPTRGAGFIDPACLVVQLVAAGHTPAEAERWAAGCTAWVDAPEKGLDAFAAATARMWHTHVRRYPDEAWRSAMAAAADAWTAHRGVQP